MSCLVVTPGEPSGIGPDVLLQAIHHGVSYPLVAIADPQLMVSRAKQLVLPIAIKPIEESSLASIQATPNTLYVLPVELKVEATAGQLNASNGGYVIDTLDVAIRLCLSGQAAGLVTGPVHKGIINESGLAFTGHTEYLRDQSNTEEVVMMLATEGLRVALVTTHLPLRDVADQITQSKVERVTRILHKSLIAEFGCPTPNILVTGLNPHAGEDGHLGMEEIDTIIPALAALKKDGIDSTGPLPADTLFQPHYLDGADAVLAMYHDQGLPVLKYKGFGNAVNITLGLPFIRTSVDHGTALDLAGTGKADTGSMVVALNTAWHMAKQRENYHA